MKLSSWLSAKATQVSLNIDLSSLRLRLTVGVAAVSAFGLGSVTVWTSWTAQNILVNTHKQNVEFIADRFPQDVEVYSEMVSVESGMQRAIDKLTTSNTVVWVQRPDGKIAAQSARLSDRGINLSAQRLARISPNPEVLEVNGLYWVAASGPLQANDLKLGKFFVAQDITQDQLMFLSMIRSLGVISVLSIAGITAAIALYIQRSLQPLRDLCQLTEKISAEHLGETHLHLDHAPSEVRELAQTFDQMLLRISEAWENQRQFVSNASHELRTPLTLVSGYLQSTLRRGTNFTQPQQEALEIAASEANRTIQLLADLLELARADGGHMRFNVESFVLNELVEEVIEMAKQYTQRVIKAEFNQQAVQVKADAKRLRQVLLNLIDNAVKYSDADQPVTVTLTQQGEQATLQVCDRGCGIPLPQQARIFERFYRVDETRCRSTGGTGLGLAIVKTLVEGMGGSVTVRSKLAEGSVFTVTLPAIASFN